MASKVSGSTPSAMCRSSESWRLKSKGEPGTSKKARQEPSPISKKGMERPAFVYLESADHPQTEEILVKCPRLLGIPAAIGIMVQTFDHPILPSSQLTPIASLCLQCSRNSQAKPVIGSRCRRGPAKPEHRPGGGWDRLPVGASSAAS